MEQAVRIVELVNLAAFTALAGVAVRQWRIRRDVAAAWAAAAFAALAVVLLLGSLLPTDPDSAPERVVLRLEILVLLLFPYLLYRFTVAFEPPSPRLARIVDSATALLVVSTLALPRLPDEGESQPWWFVAWVVAFVLHWVTLLIVVVLRLWRAGRGQPGVARRRMEMLSFGAAAMAIALVLVAVLTGDERGVDLAAQVIISLSVVAFFLGLAPPAALRYSWRRHEQGQVQRAIGSLMAQATSQREVAERVLAPMAAIVGASAVTLRDERGEVIGSHEADPAAEHTGPEVELEVPGGGSLTVATTTYAPYFGDEELRLLRTLGALTGLALDRARLFGQEREARLTLERADQLKSDFVALAAHELRSPLATAAGIAETLTRHRDRLDGARRVMLEDAMAAQMVRLGVLVDQLLDLSRLDADVVSIRPQRVHVRDRVEQVVLAAVGDATGVEVAIDAQLEAHVDPVAFDRIVANLVTNALRYGTLPIVVEAWRKDRHFRLTVEDRGEGVPAAFVPDLFERFTRSDAARDRAAGTGLGLAIARSYAQAHRGDLFYEAAMPRGARFQLVLPSS